MSDYNQPVGLELMKQQSVYEVGGRTQGYRLYVAVSQYSNIDPNVFVFEVQGPDQETGQRYAVFNRLASPADLEEYPVGIPQAEDPDPPDYFRLAEVDLVFRHPDDLAACWENLKSEQAELVRTLNQMVNSELSDPEYNQEGVLPDSQSSEAP